VEWPPALGLCKMPSLPQHIYSTSLKSVSKVCPSHGCTVPVQLLFVYFGHFNRTYGLAVVIVVEEKKKEQTTG